ncbi:hypothetical protein AHAS_Ahas06G0107800 [Arachis hypogaea]
MRRFFFDIICKFSFRINPEYIIPSFLEPKLADSFDLTSKLSVQRVAIAAHMKTKATTEHWFGEEAEGSDRSGGQCGHGDNSAEEEGDGKNHDGF